MAVVAVGLLVLVAGCSRKSDIASPAPAAPAARIVATANFGAEQLLSARVVPDTTVMDGLRSITAVETAYGGGFVASMLGRGTETAPSADWFFYVNGIQSPVGAASVTLGDGDVAWWDHHPWQGAARIRGVVGSWPQPFVNATAGVVADAPLAATLRAAGARLTHSGTPFQVLVGTDDSLASRNTAWRAIAGDPGGNYLAGGIANGVVVLIPPDGGALVPVDGARAVVVLVPVGTTPQDGALLAVAGLDAAAARAAAATIARDPAVLTNRFAVAFDATGGPLESAGRAAP